MTTLTIETPRAFKPLLKASRYKGAFGGRGSGKSHFFAELMIEHCLLHQPYYAVCIREVQKSLAESVKRLLEIKIEQLGLGQAFTVLDNRIDTPGGGQIIFQGMQNHTADSIKSLEGYNVAWVEEAQSLSQRSLDLLRPTIREEGSELWFSWNPDQPSDPIDQLLRGDNPPSDSIVVEANYESNPWFPAVLREEMEADEARDREKFLHVWRGQYNRKSDAQVFRNYTVREFDTPDGAILRFGADWGYAQDPTVLVRCFLQGRALYIDYEAYMIGCEIDQLPDLFDLVPRSRDFFIRADSARPEVIAHMKSHGFPKIQPAQKGKGSVEDGIEWLKTFDLIVHPRCKHVIDELDRYRWKVDKLTDEVLPILEDKHNHCIDALRYGCEAARHAHKPGQAKQRHVPAAAGGWMGS